MRRTLLRSAEIQRDALSMVGKDAIVIVDRADKLFFPARHVRVPLRDEATYSLLPTFLLHGEVFYYGITLPPQDLVYLNQEKLKAAGIQIQLVQTFDAESLYVFERRE
jgi:hypothetical protein